MARLVVLVIRIGVALVFLRAGATKVRHVGEFRQAIANYALLPAGLEGVASYSVPLVELLAAALLLLGVALRATAILVALMLALFSVAIAINLLRGRVIECGCSGTVASDISWRHVAVNGALAMAAVMVAVWPAEPLSLNTGASDPYGSLMWSSRGVAALLVASSAAAVALLVVETMRALAAIRTLSLERDEGAA